MRRNRKLTSFLSIAAVVAATTSTAGINAIFREGFESGDLDSWNQPVRFAVFEGFYNHG